MSDVENDPLLEGHTHRFPDSDLFWRMMSGDSDASGD